MSGRRTSADQPLPSRVERDHRRAPRRVRSPYIAASARASKSRIARTSVCADPRASRRKARQGGEERSISEKEIAKGRA